MIILIWGIPNNMKKWISLLLIACLLTLTLTACVDDPNNTDPNGGAPSTQTADGSETTDSVGTEDASQTDTTAEDSDVTTGEESTSGDVTDEGTAETDEDVDLPKVEFRVAPHNARLTA